MKSSPNSWPTVFLISLSYSKKVDYFSSELNNVNMLIMSLIFNQYCSNTFKKRANTILTELGINGNKSISVNVPSNKKDSNTANFLPLNNKYKALNSDENVYNDCMDHTGFNVASRSIKLLSIPSWLKLVACGQTLIKIFKDFNKNTLSLIEIKGEHFAKLKIHFVKFKIIQTPMVKSTPFLSPLDQILKTNMRRGKSFKDTKEIFQITQLLKCIRNIANKSKSCDNPTEKMFLS